MDILFILLLGLVVGSFLNVVILRIKRGISIASGRSACEKCAHTLTPSELIPILSYVVLRGKCLSCSVPLSLQYPLVEACTGILFVLVYTNVFPAGIIFETISLTAVVKLVILWSFLSALIVIFVYDIRWFLVPMNFTVPAIVCAYLINSIYHAPSIACLGQGISFSCIFQISWIQYAVSAGIGGFFFYAQYVLSRGQWVGQGDIYLGLLVGAMVGYPWIFVVLFIAYMIGAFISFYLLLGHRYTMKSAVPFGPFLAFGTMIVLLFHDPLLQFIQNLFYLS